MLIAALGLQQFMFGFWGAGFLESEVRKSFRDELRGTFKETMRLLFHWLLCALFISETVGVVWFLTSSRSDALASPDGTTLGMPNSYYVLAAKPLGSMCRHHRAAQGDSLLAFL